MLFSCESGSRAWGFPSQDSDYDIRFVYVQKNEKYLSVSEVQEDLQFPIYDDLDVYGWDLRKVLRLLLKCNVTPYEWIQSPIIYKENDSFLKSFRSLLLDYYCERSHANHYLGLVNGRLLQLDKEKMSLKSFFYILRGLLSAKWNVKFRFYAPMELEPLLELLPMELKDKVDRLREIKSNVDESYVFELDDYLKDYFVEEYNAIALTIKELPKVSRNNEKLDFYFRTILDEMR